MKSSHVLRVLSAACMLGLGGKAAFAQTAAVVDGTLDAAYGAPISTQTINTGFGDSTVGDGTSGGGSELDAAYGYADQANNTLYLFFSGNFENNGNHVDVFIDDGRAGANTLPAASGGALGGMAGSTFSPGFNATLAFDANDYNNTLYLDTYNFIDNSGNYAGSIGLTGGIGHATLTGYGVGFNNTNAAGVNGNTGTAVTDPSVPNAVTTGLELAIPLTDLGNPSNTTVKVLADINGGGDGYLSNQFLPGLPVGTGNVGGGGPYSVTGSTGAFNFSADANEYFTVSIPTINTWVGPTTDSNWSTTANWSSGIVPNSVGAPANFAQTSGGSITVDNAFTVGSLGFDSPGATYILTPNDQNADTITMQNVAGTDATITDYSGIHLIQMNLILNSNTDFLINNRGDSMFIYGNISGPGSLSSTNPGDGAASILYLYGTNTYTGGTIINSGTVQLDGPAALPANSALTMNATDVPDPVLDLQGQSISLSSINVITGPLTASTGAIAIIECDNGQAATITYNGASGSPSTFNGNIANNGGGTISLVVATGSLTLAGANTMTGSTNVSSGATLTLANPKGSALANSTITNNGTLNINDVETISTLINNATVNVNAGGVYQVKPGIGTYTLPGGINLTGGKIDTTDVAVSFSYTAGNDPAAAIAADIKSAFDNGAWDGPGIYSSDVPTTPGTAVGYIDQTGSNDVLVKIAWLGDLTLTGSVTADDLTTLTGNLGKTGNVTWAMGDLNYDGVINDDDLSLYMLGAALSGGAPLSVPEPAALSLLVLPALALGRRRRA